MDELLAFYAELVKAASDDQVIAHLTNLVTDWEQLASAVKSAVKSAVDQAKARVGQ